jgi:S-DNA-T family DNA segregation ATPase FtsK/SpoIIIE
VGAGIYVISLYLWYLGIEIFRGRAVLTTKSEYFGFLIFFITSLVLMGYIGGDGGYLGATLSKYLNTMLGPAGGALFSLFFMIIGISMCFKVLITSILLEIYNGTKKVTLFIFSMVKHISFAIFSILKKLIPKREKHTELKQKKGSNQKKKAKVTVYEGEFIAEEPVVVNSSQYSGLTEAEIRELEKQNRVEVSSEVVDDNETPSQLPNSIVENETREIKKEKKRDYSEYELPPIDMLTLPEPENPTSDEELRGKADKIIRTLRSFKVEAAISQITHGPSVTRFELVPATGVHVKKIVSLADDLALNLATSSIRMEAPIPGKSAVGIEVPNEKPSTVYFAELIRSKEFHKKKNPLLICLGKTITGQPVIADLAVMPHLLIAGATGSGKSVCMNTIIASILFRTTPEQVRFIMVDPKKVELSSYNDIPHLLLPVVTNPKKAQSALMWAVTEMERRYELLSGYNIRNIAGYNKFAREKQKELKQIINSDQPISEEDLNIPEELPYIVVIIDELADLMMTNTSDKVEECICRLAQMSRAVGIHLVVATQRPSVNVITGLIKANMPSRIAFMVTSVTDSRTILDMKGAESLLGRGDMLYNPVGASKPLRVQGCFISDNEVNQLTKFIRERFNTNYEDQVVNAIEGKEEVTIDDSLDPLIEDAARLVVSNKSGSTSMLQRVLKIGHRRAMEMMSQLERLGCVGPFEDKKPRKVLWTIDDIEAKFGR